MMGDLSVNTSGYIYFVIIFFEEFLQCTAAWDAGASLVHEGPIKAPPLEIKIRVPPVHCSNLAPEGFWEPSTGTPLCREASVFKTPMSKFRSSFILR